MKIKKGLWIIRLSGDFQNLNLDSLAEMILEEPEYIKIDGDSPLTLRMTWRIWDVTGRNGT